MEVAEAGWRVAWPRRSGPGRKLCISGTMQMEIGRRDCDCVALIALDCRVDDGFRRMHGVAEQMKRICWLDDGSTPVLAI